MKSFQAILVFSFLLSSAHKADSYYWIGGSGNWSDLTHWATTSGGSEHPTVVPQSTDDVFFDGNSGFNSVSRTVTIDQTIIYCRNMDWTGALNSPRLIGDSDQQIFIFGSLTLIPDLIIGDQGDLHFASTEMGNTITTYGLNIGGDIFFEGSGEWILQDELNVFGILVHRGGTFDTNDQTINLFKTFYSVNPMPRVLKLGNSTINIKNGTYFISQFPIGTSATPHYSQGLTFEAGTSTFNIENKYKTFYGGGDTFYNVTFLSFSESHVNKTHNLNVSNKLTFKGHGRINSESFSFDNDFKEVIFEKNGQIYGDNNFEKLTFTPCNQYELEKYSTQTILENGVLDANGTCEEVITIGITGLTGQAYFNKLSDIVEINHVLMKDISGIGGAIFLANNSIDLGSNWGWEFSEPDSRDLFWVAGKGNWNDSNHWSLISGGMAGECPPNLNDNVFFDENSMLNSSIDTVFVTVENAYCNNMIWNGIQNESVFEGNEHSKILIYGSLELSEEMNFSFDGDFHFSSTESGNTILSNGITILGNTFFQGTGEWILQDELSVGGYLMHSRGHLNSNNQNINLSQNFYSANPLFRTLVVENSTITIENGAYIVLESSEDLNDKAATSAGLNLELENSHFIINDGAATFYGGGDTFYNITFSDTLGISEVNRTRNVNISNQLIFKGDGQINLNSLGANNTFKEVLFEKNGNIYGNNNFDKLVFTPCFDYSLESGATQTINENGSLEANGTCENIITINSDDYSEQAFISKSSGEVLISNVICKNISAIGGANYIAEQSIDLGNNSGWSFSAVAERELFWVGGTGDWSDVNHWSLMSGGVGGECPPNPNDNVFFDENSDLNSANDTIFLNVINASCKNMVWAAIGNNVNFYGLEDSNLFLFGGLEFSFGLNFSFEGITHFSSSEMNNSITTNGVSFSGIVHFNGTGEWILQDEFNIDESLVHSAGTLTTNNQTINIEESFILPNPEIRTLNLGSSVINIENGAYFISAPFPNINNRPKFSEGLTLNAGTSHFNIYYTLFGGGGDTFYDITFHNDFTSSISFTSISNANIANQLIFEENGQINYNISSPGSNYFNEVIFKKDGKIHGNNSFQSLTLTPGHTYTLKNNNTQTITASGHFNAPSTGSFPIEIKSTIIGQQATINKDGVPLCLDFLFLTDVNTEGTAFFYVGENSDDVSNNSGFIFEDCPDCFPELPILNQPLSVTDISQGTITLVIENLPPNHEVIWFDETQTLELYADTTNNFQPTILTTPTIFYGAYRDLNNGCVSELIPVEITCAININLSESQSICEGETELALMETGGDAVSWSWTSNTGFTSNEQNPIIQNPTLGDSGIYSIVVTNQIGCSESQSIEIEVFPPDTTLLKVQICEGESYEFGEVLQSEAGIYYDSLTNINGCDSLIQLNLDVFSETDTLLEITLCEGETFILNGQNYTQTGIYNETLTNTEGCDSLVTLNLSVINSIILVDTLVTADFGSAEGSIELFLMGGQAPFTYLWSNGDTTFQISNLEAGVYSVTVTDQENCSSVFEIEVLLETSLKQTFRISDIALFPNPLESRQAFFLEINSTKSGVFDFEIMDLTGRLVQTIPIEIKREKTSKFSFDAPDNSGLYFIKISKKGEIFWVGKLVVE